MIIRYLISFISFGVILVSGMYIVNPGPRYPPTKGEVWPKPKQENKESSYYTFDPSHFKVKIINKECEILSNAIERYSYIVKHKNGVHAKNRRIRARRNHRISVNGTVQRDDLYKGVLSELLVDLRAPCEEYPSFEMDEQYYLNVSKKSRLQSDSIWGIIRGLETFSQLFYLSEDYNEIRINTTEITDFPSYPHRGLLLDTSRHYITVSNILKTLDAMAINKMNVFHWHIVDDQSFPYQSEKFPELSGKGAFHSSMVYTKEDIERIIQYARIRGIRVVPEFDVPGHTRSWGVAFPSILTQCYEDEKVVGLGPINPLSDVALKLLKDLFEEVHEWFPDKFLHVGGDEVDLDCWRSNPELIKYMKDNNVTAEGLHALFMGNVIPLLNNNTNPMVWQEVFDENVALSKDTIIQVWKYQPTSKMIEVLSAGHRVLFSSNWYLDYLSKEWSEYYKYDPRQMVYNSMKNETFLPNIVGGEACMWGEMVDDRNVINRVWPRASAVAEKLWSSVLDPNSPSAVPAEAYNRMEEHACRMLRRGIDAQPSSGPGFLNIGPRYPPTKGEVWPKAQKELKEDNYYTLHPSQFKIKIINQECEILSNAVKRYFKIVTLNNGVVNGTVQRDDLYKGLLSELKVDLRAPCEEYPSLQMDEQYYLKIANESKLESNSIWGILRGLETFAQLFYYSDDYNELRINGTEITDFPTYPHRGLLLDTSRHYISVRNILKTLDAMGMNKMNVFHWHIVDDQSFPYQSKKFPELSKKGAYYSSMVYTKEDIWSIVQHARQWGIRVVPEFDVPGHTRSWGAAYPEILTKCYKGGKVVGLGPINPLSDVALKFLKELFEEVQEWFPDKFIHVGGDEVDLNCWQSNPEIAKYMRDNNMTPKDLHGLFMKNVIPMFNNKSSMVWQEVFDEKVPLSKETIIQVWKYFPTIEMKRVLKAGHRVIFSSAWYLSSMKKEWPNFYQLNPRQMLYDYINNKTVLLNILGGEACMWGEMVDDRNVITRVWPRASAIAEVLWSSVLDPNGGQSAVPAEVYNRIEEHACRMLRRGVDAQPPSGPGFCVVNT